MTAPYLLPLNCLNNLQIPDTDLEELKAFALEAVAKPTNPDDDYWDAYLCKSETMYDLNIYSDRVYGSGETDGINVTAYGLKFDGNDDVTTDTSKSYSLLYQWEPANENQT